MKVAFLDRDGVVNKEVNYLHKISDFEYTPRCKEALKNIRNAGYQIIIVTNQAGIARGFYTEADYDSLTKWYVQDLESDGINILDIFHCPHHPSGVDERLAVACDCRKPNPGMLVQAAEKHGVDLSKSVLVGDKLSDVEAGRNAGVEKLVLVRSGHALPALLPEGVEVFDNLFAFSNTLVLNKTESKDEL